MTVFVDVTGRGPDLALLHGWGLNGAVWNGVRAALAQHFTLHIVDLPGHGRSPGAPVTTRAAFVDAVHHALPAKCHLMGWSLGGHTALALAATYPARVDKLITVCCTPRFVEGDGWAHGKPAAVLADFVRRLSTDYAATIRNFLALQALNQPNMREVIRALQQAVGAHGAPAPAALAASLAILSTSDLRTAIPSIAHPALVVQGTHDALTSPDAAAWLAATLPNAKYCLMPSAAHAPFLSHREDFLAHVTGFLHA
ncbi:MAG: pimeloyl-ACP methyl ester esterase BioH [Betaproteobacteria bacterium]|nr:pimeloyl-ACP methyl ester esterase BioH [Betaproteobacteria bacterium]